MKVEETLAIFLSVSPPSSLNVLIYAEPYILIMEYVSYGTLRTFLQTNRVNLSADPELQSLLTIASYHIALAMQHLRSKMVITSYYEVLSCRLMNENVICYYLSTLTNHRPMLSSVGVVFPADSAL